jgi:broad specificity phosphatase PhoE
MRQLYLLCHGQTRPAHTVLDPYSADLTPAGEAQAHALARACQAWQIEYLAVSTTLHAQQTADIIHGQLPLVARRDLQDLEDVALDDLNLDPTATHRLCTWTPAQRQAGLRQTWTRVTAAQARVLLYAERNAVTRIAFVAGQDILSLLLLSHLGLDWRVDESLSIQFEPGSATRLTLGDDARVSVDWVNRLSFGG